ncbi:response regulator [uncultured Herbaspirillum sp.]|uniref:response regulator n=1 Tax=uncultured Herbaspirillum sp. TaxID=160236 RepID=UPI00258C72AF|nr:response regulator [uncultured Herbaspirillum sp.]
MKTAKTSSSEVCTTQEAAHILGISVSSVQQLVEAGIIEAWKTKGGHRRIPLAAVHAYKATPGSSSAEAGEHGRSTTARPSNGRTAVLVIEDNHLQRELYAGAMASWDLPLDLVYCDNGYKALLEIARSKPDVVLADIVMEGMDGYEVVKTILHDPQLRDVSIAIVSSLGQEDMAQRGGIPAGVVFFPKPVNFDELRGYMRACCARRERESR